MSAATVWAVMYLIAGSPNMNLMGMFSTKADCEFVQKQLKEKVHARTAECIEIPTLRPQQRPNG